MRYKFYREHKYVCAAVNDVERLAAKTNFNHRSEVEKLRSSFDALVNMLKGHAYYENNKLHELLKKKNSAVYKHIEDDHTRYEQQLNELRLRLNTILENLNEEEQVELGYQFYLWFRKFAGENLLHLHEEETVLLPELQRLYTDEELSVVEFESYQVMTPYDLVHMMEALFPHMNLIDKAAFLTDIRACDTAKFAIAWQDIQSKLEPDEIKDLVKILKN